MPHPTDLKHKALPVAGLKVLDEANGIVEAYVAGIGNKDSVGDIIQPGAFVESLKNRTPKGVWSHNWDLPISKTLEAREVPAGSTELPQKMKTAGIGGLYVKTQFNLGHQRGRDALADVVFYDADQEWSIGYREEEAKWDDEANANLVSKIDLFEYSPVLFGANPLTATLGMKAAARITAALDAVKEADVSKVLKDEDVGALEELREALVADEKDGGDVGHEGGNAPEEPGQATPVAPGVAGTEAEAGSGAADDDTKDDTAEGAGDAEKAAEGDEKVAEGAVMAKQAVPGSYEERREALSEAIRSWVATEFDADNSYGWPCATFDSTVVASIEVYSEDDGWTFGYWQFDYVFADGEATLSNAEEVDLVQVIVAKGEAEILTPAVKAALAAYSSPEAVAAALSLLGTGAVSDEKAAAFYAVKAGRVLSKANFAKIEAAVKALTEVIDAAQPESTDTDEDAKTETSDDEKADLPEKAEDADDAHVEESIEVTVADGTPVTIDAAELADTIRDLENLANLAAA